MAEPEFISGMPFVQFFLWLSAGEVAFFGFIYATFILPERKRRMEVYQRLTNIEQEQSAAKLWRESHERSHSKVEDSVDEVTRLLYSIDKRLAIMEQIRREEP